ncbi:hypothetical protein Glove_606g11 [Diversispora epigaea]|uniref:Uncharacterized protein n=1 Tax=Diversispora epigaea TaxID=1348612 RepID=A0A397G744_9GLOM|nr:hypothetical protein Glove_606g11 [Diversispora epigaea]
MGSLQIRMAGYYDVKYDRQFVDLKIGREPMHKVTKILLLSSYSTIGDKDKPPSVTTPIYRRYYKYQQYILEEFYNSNIMLIGGSRFAEGQNSRLAIITNMFLAERMKWVLYKYEWRDIMMSNMIVSLLT